MKEAKEITLIVVDFNFDTPEGVHSISWIPSSNEDHKWDVAVIKQGILQKQLKTDRLPTLSNSKHFLDILLS